MLWSPPSYSAHSSPSIQATTSSRTGEPCALGDQRTPANLSTPDRAKFRETASWPSDSTFTQNRPIDRSAGHVCDVRAGAKATSGGSSDNELNDWQVNPAGPSGVRAVTTVTPDAKWPSTSRMTSGSTIRGTSGEPVMRRSGGP